MAAVAALPGFLYVPFQLHRLGPLPDNAAEVEAFADGQLRGYRLLASLERATGDRCVVYAFNADHLHSYARVPLLGTWGGPWGYEWVGPLLGDPPRLHRALRGSGVTHLLLPASDVPPALRAGGDGRFRLVGEEDGYVAFAVLAPPRGARRR